MSVAFRRAVPSDFPEVRRITRDAYLRVGHFSAEHPYMSVLEDVEHRADHAEVWVAEADGRLLAAVTLAFAGQPYSEIAIDGELEFRMLAVDPAAPRQRAGAGGGGNGGGACPAGARHRSDQHHQRQFYGTRPQPL